MVSIVGGCPGHTPRYTYAMQNKSDPSSFTIQHVANSFRNAGWVSFWVQIVLGVIAIVTLVFANAFRGTPTANVASGINFGLFCAFIGLALLAASIFFSFRYTRLSRQLRLSEAAARPKKAEVIKVLKLGLSVNLIGTLVSLVSANAVVGGLATKASRLANPFGGLSGQQSDFVNIQDMFNVQAILLILLALFAGTVAPLWLLNRLNRP
jgi:hypothetical protein